jgi:glyoxylate reductase
MKMTDKPKVYLTSNVFSAEEIGSNEKISEKIRIDIRKLWQKLENISILKIFDGRFPSEKEIKNEVNKFNPDILGCHLSHIISSEILENSNIFAISTSTAGYNHIIPPINDDILITHTPGVLQEAVADYTIALIMGNLRNLNDLHNYVWNNEWNLDDKWDLDQSLSSITSNKVLGIIGLGEIGKELVKRLHPWGIRIIYHDRIQMKDFEKKFTLIDYRKDLADIFRESDIISLHVPLNNSTVKMVNRDLLKLMKKNALLVNTSRGSIIDLETLLVMLENREIQINLAFDVFPIEPIDNQSLERLRNIKKNQPHIRMILMPHNASSDADTRGKMNIIFLKNIIRIIKSSSLVDLRKVHLIPEHEKQLNEKQWKIYHYWKKNDKIIYSD